MSEQENKNDVNSAEAVRLLFRMNLDRYKIFSKIDKLSEIRAAPDVEKSDGEDMPGAGILKKLRECLNLPWIDH